jgi:glyoxylase-like metal-dependent hydrolase (beta-lactamase superfamily II)
MNRLTTIFLLLCLVLSSNLRAATPITDHVSLLPGPTNGVLIEKDSHRLIIYGDPTATVPAADMVLLTHARRDIVSSARHLVAAGAPAIVPADDIDNFLQPQDFWNGLVKTNFHSPDQQTTKLPTRPLKSARGITPPHTLTWQGIDISVVNTPGYTRSALSYILDIDGRRFAFTGDLIYGDSRLFDLYTLQDAISPAGIGTYHGYAGRLSILLDSLRSLASLEPDIIIPARGPVIDNPQKAIGLLIRRLQALYRNYLSISAGRWYFTKQYDTLARMTLAPDPNVPWMPWPTAPDLNPAPPAWIIPIANARLIVSDDRRGFLIDCGSKQIVDEIDRLRTAGTITALDGLFITHYHNDHLDGIPELLERFPCPVYSSPCQVDILRNPDAYHMPAMSAFAIPNIHSMPHDSTMQWKEYRFTFYDFPGQTIHHSALLVTRPDTHPIFFIGDSFTPSGIDDYCLLNRNIMRDGVGYLRCIDMLRTVPAATLLINQHVTETFRFTPARLDHMTAVLHRRAELMADLFPWDDINYAIDEQWARFLPYGLTTSPDRKHPLSFCISNHSPAEKTFTVTPSAPAPLTVSPAKTTITIAPHSDKSAAFDLTIPQSAAPGNYVVTADVAFDTQTLTEWAESIIAVLPPAD